MIANAQSKIQIVDTHELLETLVNIDVPVGMAQFNRTLVNLETKKPYTTISKVWDRLRNKAGLPRLRCHDLRHLAASLMINSGASLYTVQQVLGHSNPSVTERNAHLSQRTLQERSNRASAVIQSAMQQSQKQSQQQDVQALMQGTVVDSEAVLVQ
jgi:hypothetical protein